LISLSRCALPGLRANLSTHLLLMLLTASLSASSSSSSSSASVQSRVDRGLLNYTHRQASDNCWNKTAFIEK